MKNESHSKKVAVTGVGIVACIGFGNDEVTRSLRTMRSGVRLDAKRQELGFRSALSGVIEGFSPRFLKLSRKQRKSMPEFVEWATDATFEALQMAGIEADELKQPDVGLIFGNDSVARSSFEQADLAWREKNTSVLHSGMIFRSMNSTVTMNLNALLGTQGASWTLSGACASGSLAVGQAADLIALGRQRIVICGGAQEITWESQCSFDALCAFSVQETDPERASRPFDRKRDGLVPSGGAATLILEDLDDAKARGATILAEVASYAFSSDGDHIAVPNGDGIERCMVDAIKRAGLVTSDIDYVCAHATSTPVGDAVEAEAIKRVFDGHRPWVSSVKSMVGHEMWMAGASQVVYSILAANAGFIPGNLNYEEPDDRTRGIRVSPENVPETPEYVLCNSAGFGGTNSCLVLRIVR